MCLSGDRYASLRKICISLLLVVLVGRVAGVGKGIKRVNLREILVDTVWQDWLRCELQSRLFVAVRWRKTTYARRALRLRWPHMKTVVSNVRRMLKQSPVHVLVSSTKKVFYSLLVHVQSFCVHALCRVAGDYGFTMRFEELRRTHATVLLYD